MPDPPESPIREPADPAFQFVEDVPAAGWDDTVVVDAEIGEYTVTARRKGEEWFLGAMTGDTGRALEIPLSFLDGEYVAEMYSDGPDAEWDTNLTDVTVEEVIVDESTTLSASMVTSGGMAVRFRPPEDGEADSLPAYEGPNQSVSVSLSSAVGFGEPFVSVTGENTGSTVGGTLLEVVVDGEVSATELVRIPAGESDYSGMLSASIGGGGEYDVVVRGATARRWRRGRSPSAPTPGPAGRRPNPIPPAGSGPDSPVSRGCWASPAGRPTRSADASPRRTARTDTVCCSCLPVRPHECGRSIPKRPTRNSMGRGGHAPPGRKAKDLTERRAQVRTNGF
nr:glycoside hydrolase family 97 C-terminal domain-containing protein [Halapricum sp. CBA1109]